MYIQMHIINRTLLLSIAVFAISCGQNRYEEDSFDFSEFPILVSAPVLDKTSITAGETVVINLQRRDSWGYIDFLNIGGGSPEKSIGYGYLPDDYEQSTISIVTDCGGDSGSYYPRINLYYAAVASFYSNMPSISLTNYALVQFSSESYQTIDSGLKFPILTLTQPAGSSLADLSVMISSVSKNESDLTINYEISNNGAKGAAYFLVQLWSNSATKPEELNSAEANDDLLDGTCINAGQTLSRSKTFSTTANSGTAYVLVDGLDHILEIDDDNNFSEGFAW